MTRISSALRLLVTPSLIRLGPRNRLVNSLVNRKCQRFDASLTIQESFLCLRKGGREMRLASKHFVYAPTLAEHFDDYFNDLVPEDIDGRKVLDYSRPGILQTYLRSGLQFQMASFPEEEEAIEGYFHWYTPKVGDTIFDIGAHCGVSSYHFAKLVGSTGHVVAFEPDPVNFSLLV